MPLCILYSEHQCFILWRSQESLFYDIFLIALFSPIIIIIIIIISAIGVAMKLPDHPIPLLPGLLNPMSVCSHRSVHVCFINVALDSIPIPQYRAIHYSRKSSELATTLSRLPACCLMCSILCRWPSLSINRPEMFNDYNSLQKLHVHATLCYNHGENVLCYLRSWCGSC